MALPASKNLTFYQGDSFSLKFRLKNPDTDVYLDLAGCTPKAQVRANADDASVMVEFTAALGSNPGEVVLSLTPVQTAALTLPGVWDVQLTFPDGSVRTYLAGTTKVVKEITRA